MVGEKLNNNLDKTREGKITAMTQDQAEEPLDKSSGLDKNDAISD